MSQKTQVQDSSDCCINSKYSSTYKGYFQDEFLSLFTKRLHKRSPIINRGYYIRFKAMEDVFYSWLSFLKTCSSQNFQIISLGAGYDSSYLRLRNSNKLHAGCLYIEIDFLDVMKKKLEYIQKVLCSDTKTFTGEISADPVIVTRRDDFCMLGIDLTNIATLQKYLSIIGIKYDSPTLFFSECSITYIDPKDSENLILWAQRNFPNSTFVTYEQVYPDDAFGLIMRSHFTNVGCTLKSITKYPNEESQYHRFKNAGWSDCSVSTMHDLFCSLPCEEKYRIQNLELFDEYEMWHEKCHHYVLVWASQGMLSKALPSLLVSKSFSGYQFEQSLFSQKSFKWDCEPVPDIIHRFGHQVISLSAKLLLMSGGFGLVEKRHQRLSDISLYQIETKSHLNICPGHKKHLIGERMFHTMTKLSNNTIVILGGRSSPKKVFKDVLILSGWSLQEETLSRCGNNSQLISEDFPPVSLSVSQFSMLVPSWRHSASLVTIKGTECIIVFGGRCVDQTALNRGFILNTETWMWSEINVQKNTPSARHSHSAVSYNKRRVIVTGGLSENETVLSSVHMYDSEFSEWSILPISGLYPRYSHTSHIWGDHLFLVGGVTSTAACKLGIGIVNLLTLQALEIHSPAQDPEYPILLCNHSSYLQEDKIYIFGGGGNCFSFGTHFNKKIVAVDVKCLL